MDPKQTSPLGSTPGGGQEGQNPSSVSAGANSGATPVFSSGTNSASAGTPASDQKMPGTLGAENLSTGANVSRTMESLNSKNQSETGTSVFSKHKFDRAEPDGSILIPESKGLFFRKSRGDKDNDVTGSMIAARGESVDGLDPETRRKRRMLRIGGIVGGVLAVALIVGIVIAFVVTPRGGGSETINRTELANWIEENVNSNDLIQLETSFEDLSNESVDITELYNNENSSVYNSIYPTINILANMTSLLDANKNKRPEELAVQLSNLSGIIKERSDYYSSLALLIDSFHEAISSFQNGNKNALDLLNNDIENEEVQTIIEKTKEALVQSQTIGDQISLQGCNVGVYRETSICRNIIERYYSSLSYIEDGQLIKDIVSASGGAINYGVDGYLNDKIFALYYSLINGSKETTSTETTDQAYTVEQLPYIERVQIIEQINVENENE